MPKGPKSSKPINIPMTAPQTAFLLPPKRFVPTAVATKSKPKASRTTNPCKRKKLASSVANCVIKPYRSMPM